MSDASDNEILILDLSGNQIKNEIVSVDFKETIKEYTEQFINGYNKLKSDLYDIDWLDSNYKSHKFTIRTVVILVLLISFSTMFHSLRLERHEYNMYNMNNEFSKHKKMLDDHHESIHQLLKYNFIKQSESCQYKFTSPTYVPTPDQIKSEIKP
jgi:phage regulator Rha-like protein